MRFAEDSASSELWPMLLARADEKWVTERAYENPMFVEDLVRDVAFAPGRGSRASVATASRSRTSSRSTTTGLRARRARVSRQRSRPSARPLWLARQP